MRIFLIQGFFFQNYQWLGLGMGSQGEGVISTLNEGLCRFMFSGVLYPDRYNALDELIGHMKDHYGQSAISKAILLPEDLEFIKKYDGHSDEIKYKFRKHNGLWIGGYSGSDVGKGGAKCILTEVPEDLLQPPTFERGDAPKAVEGFEKLMDNSGDMPQETIRQSPHFGTAALPDDDW
jgi:hypothetical protein